MFENKIDKLLEINEHTWLSNMLSKDILTRKLKIDIRNELLENTLRCAQLCASQFLNEYGSDFDIYDVFEKNGLKLDEISENDFQCDRLFGQFEEPNIIRLNKELVTEVKDIFSNEYDYEISLSRIEKLILAHEFFHYYESQNESNIYTRNKHITLWKFLKFQHKTTLPILSEIGAMAFSNAVNHDEVYPCLLDIVLHNHKD